MAKKISPALVFPVAGHFILIPYNDKGKPDMTRAYCSNNGVVVSIARDMTLNTTDLPDGNSPYPAAKYVTTQEGTLTYVLSTYDPELEALVSGAKYKDGSPSDNADMWVIHNTSIPASTPYEITFDEGKQPKSIDNISITDTFGNNFEATAGGAGALAKGALTAGQFSYDSSTKKITFAEADAGKDIGITYSYAGKEIVSVEYQENPKITTFMAIVIGETKDKDETSSQRVNVVVDRCTVSGAVTPPTASNDPTTGWTLTTNVLKPRAGHNPVIVRFEPIEKM